MVNPSYTFGCPNGARVVGTDRIGQVILPANIPKSACGMNFAKAFTKAPVCVANVAIGINEYFDDIPAIAVQTTPSMVRFIVGKPGGDLYNELTLNYFCFEAPEANLLQFQVQNSSATQVFLNNTNNNSGAADTLIIQNQENNDQIWFNQ